MNYGFQVLVVNIRLAILIINFILLFTMLCLSNTSLGKGPYPCNPRQGVLFVVVVVAAVFIFIILNQAVFVTYLTKTGVLQFLTDFL